MTRFTRLERAVMDALAHDLRHQVPDLAGQFEESRPSVRRNTGFGLFTEMIVDRNRPAPASGPTGDFGSVHAMIGKLPDPIAFKVRLRHGVLLGLLGDSYGQDTRAIDFAAVSFDQVFMLDEQGESVAWEPAQLMRPSPLLDLHRHGDHEPAPPPPRQTLQNVGPRQRLQDAEPRRSAPAPTARPSLPTKTEPRPERPARSEGPTVTGLLVDIKKASESPAARDAFAALFGSRHAAPLPDMSRDEKVSLIVGLWVAIAAGVAIAVVAFQASLIFSIVIGSVLGRWLQSPRGLVTVRRANEAWKAFRAASAG